MSKSDTFENDVLKLIFNATAIANIADNAASSPLTNLQLGLHSADPGDTGTQATSELAYTGYARVAVARTSGGFTVTGNSVSPVADATFGTATGGTMVPATHASIGVASSGATKYLYSGTLSPNVTISSGVAPVIAAGSTVTED